MSTLKIIKDGIKIWENEKGQLHREDGPACIYPNGMEYWFLNDQIHRADGPAVTHPNPNGINKFYFLYNKKLTKEEWFKQIPKEQRIKMAFNLDEL